MDKELNKYFITDISKIIESYVRSYPIVANEVAVLEQELNKYFIPDISKIIESHANPYRIAMSGMAECSDDHIITIVNLDSGVTTYFEAEYLLFHRFVLYDHLLYYVLTAENDTFTEDTEANDKIGQTIMWKLCCYNIDTQTSTNIINNKDIVEDFYPNYLEIKDSVLTISNGVNGKECKYSLLENRIVDPIPVKVKVEPTSKVYHKASHAYVPSEPDRIVVSYDNIIIDGYRVDGEFLNEYKEPYIIHVKEDFVYVINNFGYDGNGAIIYVYDYKRNLKLEIFTTYSTFDYYIFSDESKVTKGY